MDTIRQSTIEQLRVVSPCLDPIRQIVAARRYNCAILVNEPIQALMARTQKLTLEEMQILPIEDLHTIVDGRENQAQKPRCTWCPSTSSICNNCRRMTYS